MDPERAPGYLDAIAGIPPTPATLSAWKSAATQAWSDPARMHHAGRASGVLLDSARASIANFLGVSPANVFFAGSGPDALRATIGGIFTVRSGISARILVGSVESMAVFGATGSLPGAEVVPLGLDHSVNTGALDLEDLHIQLTLGAAMACIQVANAEVGTRQPFIQALSACRAAGVPLVADATAVITHDPLPADFDVLVAPAKDWGGPPGVAIVVTNPHLRWRPEEAPDRGWIGGFPDIPAAVAAAVALEEVAPLWQGQADSNRMMIDQVRSELMSMNLTCAGDPVNRLPHVLTFSIEGAAGGALVTELDKRGIQVASGSACTADTRMPSHVLEAMGLPNDSSIRISLPPDCSGHTIDRFLAQLPVALAVVTE
jgi:cysteine desulfurase